jgi:hypothetical protein
LGLFKFISDYLPYFEKINIFFNILTKKNYYCGNFHARIVGFTKHLRHNGVRGHSTKRFTCVEQVVHPYNTKLCHVVSVQIFLF